MPTPKFNPDEAIIGGVGGPRYPDPAMFLLATLREQWDEANTDKVAPEIDLAEDMKGVDFRDTGQIVVTTISGRTEPVTIGYQFKNEYETVSLDFFMGQRGGRRGLIKLVREAERIVDTIRTDTYGPIDPDITGRQWLKWGVRVTNFEKTFKGFWRRTVEVEVLWRFRQIVNKDMMC